MIKTLSKSLRQHKKGSLLTILLSVLEVAFEIFIPLCMSRLIDFGIEKGNMAQVWRYGAALVIFAMIQLTAGIISARTAARASAGFAANLRQDMYDNVQTFSFSNIDRFSASSIVTRLTTDITNIQNAYQMLIRMAVRGPVMMIFALIVSFNINREISMVFLAVIPLLAVFLMLIIRRVNPIFNGVFRAYDRLNNVVQENVRGIRVVKSFNRSDSEINKFEGISESIFRGFAKGERLLALNTPLMQFFMYACMLLISWLGAKAIVACGNDPALGLTTGGLTALISYATQILVSLMMLSMVFAMIVIAVSSAARISEILSEKTDISNPDSPVTEVKNGDVSFENVSFAYSFKADKWVLDKVNINISSGEIIGILGGTGSSKSSLVQLIPRLYDATEGRVTVGGVDVRKYDLDALRGSVAMVLQKNELFSGTVKENLRWGNENAADEEIRHACRLACADEFISTLPDGYDTHIEQGGSNVSGGQKQRLCIARALLKKPKVLILDDSTSAVDTKTDASIQRSFAEYIPETTKIIISQRVSSVMHADRIIVLDGGRVNATGSHEELLKSCGIYREIFLSQQKGAENDE
ncbi:MAG: ABC transporter ATP-binding protein [Candidatus Ornithomonoglobus sp.]